MPLGIILGIVCLMSDHIQHINRLCQLWGGNDFYHNHNQVYYFSSTLQARFHLYVVTAHSTTLDNCVGFGRHCQRCASNDCNSSRNISSHNPTRHSYNTSKLLQNKTKKNWTINSRNHVNLTILHDALLSRPTQWAECNAFGNTKSTH